MTENQPPEQGHTYVLDPESSTEMARLMLEEMQMPNFRGLGTMLTVWGEKPIQ
jgi:hypothetical protein